VRHELLEQGDTITVISRPLPYTCASFIFAHAATPIVYCRFATRPPEAKSRRDGQLFI